ncbi:phage tail assembly protein [Paenibacillus spiritus]|uniref:Phage tail assembly protein n=1 Tax=Paenibacillus spiritus TaxID=2496557 RepID=A0A5J5G8B8_9BACL|nr:MULTISPECIES: phage tail assembly protein [Paenibacillus]KAA9003988.1 phage tail assembly protein [Paenibacillus spiritus]
MNEENVNAASVAEEEGEDKAYALSRPVVHEGATYETLTMDFDAMTGSDILAATRQYKAENSQSINWAMELDKDYQAYIVAKAAHVHVGLIRALPAKDFTRLTLRAQNFLLL